MGRTPKLRRRLGSSSRVPDQDAPESNRRTETGSVVGFGVRTDLHLCLWRRQDPASWPKRGGRAGRLTNRPSYAGEAISATRSVQTWEPLGPTDGFPDHGLSGEQTAGPMTC